MKNLKTFVALKREKKRTTILKNKERLISQTLEIRESKGITLIALVVTIVVLLILAGITITALFGENGLIERAKIADQKTVEGAANDISAIESLDEQVDVMINGPTTMEDLMTKVSKYNKTVYDKYGNKIRVPAGFKILAHGSGNHIVEYTYDKEGEVSTNIPVVQDGIVIQNETDLNEFVWVPVGEIKNDAVENTTNKTTITLGRYSNYTVAADGTLPTPAQVASKTDYDTPIPIDTYYIEISSDFAGGTFGGTEYKAAGEYTDYKGVTNTKAFNLQEWISTSLDNGGYYIARYEASKNGEKAASKATTVASATSNGATITDGMLWN
ncbi:MAG: Tfp pilus assembly protein FimT/FimU, partial [Clostridia bacterium]